MPAVIETPKTITKDQAVKYLKIYNADIEWGSFIEEVFQRDKKSLGEDKAKQLLRARVAFTVMYPAEDPSVVSDMPQKLLFGCNKFTQFTADGWIEKLFEVFQEDEKIEIERKKILSLGIIHPLVYSPITRQAHNWLVDRAVSSGLKTEQVANKMQSLVFIYGGAIICNVFMKPEWSKAIEKIPNWRSGYFFEKLIYRVYDKPEQLMKIKQQELKRADPKLIKQIRNHDGISE